MRAAKSIKQAAHNHTDTESLINELVRRLVRSLEECQEKVKSLEPAAPAALPAVSVAPAAAVSATPAAVSVAPAPTLKEVPVIDAVLYEGIKDNDLLSNDINKVDKHIKTHLGITKIAEYNSTSGTTYTSSLNGKEIVLECMNASGNNLDCFVHAFLTAVFPAFRSAVALQSKSTDNQPYKHFATMFRTEVIPRIIIYLYNERVKTERIKSNPTAHQDQYNLASRMLVELKAENTQLSDDLIQYLCDYYNIRILLFGHIIRHGGSEGIPIATSWGAGTGSNYAISNPGGGHFEPCRLKSTKRYILTGDECSAFTTTYAPELESEAVKERERHFSNLNTAKQRGTVTTAGNVTQAYIDGDAVVLKAEILYDIATSIKKSYFGKDGGNSVRENLDIIQTVIRDLEISYVSDRITKAEANKQLDQIGEIIERLKPTTVAKTPVPTMKAGEWQCKACTFINKESATKCEACGTSKPKKGGKRRVRTHRKKHRTGFRRISLHSRRH